MLEAGFVHHRDLRRLSGMPGERLDNILLTSQGFRLIDVGTSALRPQVGDRLFERFVAQEWAEFEAFRGFFLAR